MKIKIKAYIVLGALLLLLGLAGHSMANISGDAEYVAAAGQQSIYKLDVAKARGTIFDCNLTPLTGSTRRRVAAVAPTIESIGAIESATAGKYRDRLAAALADGKPFAMEIDRWVEDNCVDMFNVPKRYQEDQLAPHVVGYLDSLGRGAAGIELAMDDALHMYSGEISVYYTVDALGRVIAGAQRLVADSLEKPLGGVAVTLDSKIQQLAEESSKELGKGAVVVTEAPNCEIRALVSLPDFDPNRIGEITQSREAPLLNRAFCPYSPGSVFKLVAAAAELENGKAGGSFECTGSLNAGGLAFHCFDGKAHGKVNLKGAIEKSCNCYFISSVRAMGAQPVLAMAYNLGLGAGQEFGRGLYSDAGLLPEAKELSGARALANFSFGQGTVTTTPLQLCGMLNAIAADGVYSTPKLIAGLVSEGGELIPQQPVTDVVLQAMSGETAKKLREYMINGAKQGTGAAGAPTGVTVGIKTGTAQTGIFDNGEELCNFWYCGFVEDSTGRRYCITVLKESVAKDGGATGRVFRKVAEGLAGLDTSS